MHRADSAARVIAFALALAFAAVAPGCGGGSSETRGDDEITTPPPDDDSNREPTQAEKLRAAHFQACEDMCPLLTRCAMVELRANMDQLSPEDRAEAEKIGPQELRANTDQCLSQCQGGELSVRQVEVVRDCITGLPVDSDPELAQCNELMSCLLAAQKQD
jgi:hypothetical protein